MHRLVYNEWIKIFRRAGTYIMMAIIILCVIAVGFFTKSYSDLDGSPNQDWKEEVRNQIQADKAELEDIPKSAEAYKKYLQQQIAINEYRLENNIPPDQENTAWTFVKDNTSLISLVGLFSIIVAAGIVASEFSWGTIKLLLIRPISRFKILLSKYIAALLFVVAMLFILFISSYILGAILFGTGGENQVHLAYENGKVVEQSILFYLIKTYFYQSIGSIMLMTMAFMISSVFRNSSLAIGISIFLLFIGDTVTSLIAMKYDWAKYLLFANTNLMQYFDGVPIVEGMTLGFSITMLIIYFLIFQILAFTVFIKRDVSA